MQWKAPPPDEHRAGVDADRAAPGEERADALDRLVVEGRTVGGHGHGRVGDVEVHVARRHHATVFVDDAPR